MKKGNPLGRLLELSKDEYGRLLFSIVFGLIGVLGGIVPYIAANQIILKLLADVDNIGEYTYWILVGLGGYSLKSIFYALSLSKSHQAAFNTIKSIRARMIEKLPRLPLGTILDSSSGKLKQTIIDQVETMEKPIAHLIPEFTANILGILAVYIYIFILDWRMGLVSLLSLPLGMVFFGAIFKNYEEKYKGSIEVGNRMNLGIVEYVEGIEVIKTFNQGEFQYKRFHDSILENASYYCEWMKETQLYMCISKAIMPTTLLGVLPIGWIFFKSGSLNVDVFFMVVILSFTTSDFLMSLMNFFDSLAKLGGVIAEVDFILEAEEQVHSEEKVVFKNMDIALSQVSFGYQEDKKVISNVSLDIRENSVNGFVGPSGGGKSTLAKLIAGYWDIDHGAISIGGIDLKDIPLEQLYETVSFVSQDNYLFNESVMDNIRMGRLSATDQEVVDIARKSGCHDFISELERGYETIVGSGGGHLSGGERQRIALARAMIKDAPIVILDEATSYIDPENEAIIKKAIKNLLKDKTVIMIAHRLSTITDVDRIFLIDRGIVKTSGKHGELLADSKLYRSMWQSHLGIKEGEHSA